MKKYIILIVLILFSLPVFAENFFNENAVNASIYHLKKLIRQNHLKEQLRFLEFDNDKISEILLMKNNSSDSVKNEEIRNFGASCKNRSKIMLNNFRHRYFLPSYNVYRSIDKENEVTFNDWIENVGMAKESPLYKYYVNLSENYKDCDNLLKFAK